jgi:hypothetical protein
LQLPILWQFHGELPKLLHGAELRANQLHLLTEADRTMTRILAFQELSAVGIEAAAAGELSTCSYIGCGNSTASCVACCQGTCEKTSASTF